MTLTEWQKRAQQIAHNRTKQELIVETLELLSRHELDTEGFNLRRAAVFYAESESEKF